MKIQHKIIGASIIAGVFIWIIDAVLDFLFYNEATFFELLIFHVPLHHLYIRIVGLGSFLIFGIVIAKVMALRKKAKDDLEYAHSDLNQIFNASVSLCVIGRDFKMIKVNDTFCNFFGLKRKEILGKKCNEIWEDKLCNTVECPLLKVLGGMEECESEVEKKLSNGKKVSCIVTAIPYRSPKGELLGVVENFTDVTYRKRVEEEIKHINTELDQIFSTAADGMRVIDKEFNVFRINKTLSNMSGISKDEAVGKKCYKTFHGTFCHTANCPLTRILNGEEHVEYDVEKERTDGTIIPCIVTATPFRKTDGELIGIVEDFKDITERKRSEEALLKSEERFRNLVETTSDWIWEVDKNCKYTYVSPNIYTILGYEPQEVIGKTPFDFMPPEEARRVADIFDSIVSAKNLIKELENTNLHKDGYYVILETSGVPFFAEDGTLLGYRGIDRNITERKRAEEELEKYRCQLEKLVKERTVELTNANEQLKKEISERIRTQKDLQESEIKYSSLVEQAKDGVSIVQGNIFKFVNKALADIAGYTVDELLEKPFMDIIAPESREPLAQKYKSRIIGEEISPHTETKIKCKDGTIKHVESSSCIIKYNNQPAILTISRDVTEHKRMEEEIQKVEKLESLGILAGGIAHDFNNLLTAILGNLSIAELYIKPEDRAYETLARAKKASKHATQLTQQLLTFSKGGAPIMKTSSISEIIEDTTSFVLRGSNVRCEYSIPDGLWLVEIDKGQISQVINNLIMNANHAMPMGGVIRIEAENVLGGTEDCLPLKEGKYIKISVKDKGIGILEEYIPKIFDPYFTTKENGSGLGLATCYAIINKHGGYITVESKMGVGTTFHIYLPASEKEVFEVHEIEEEKSYLGHGKILFMDDKEDVIQTATEMLTQLGYKVLAAKNGAEAIELYKKAQEAGEPFKAVILDLTISGDMGGKEAIKKLHEIDPNIKSIVSSGYSNDPVMSEYMSYGFNGVVAKPYEVKELSKVLFTVINGKEEAYPNV